MRLIKNIRFIVLVILLFFSTYLLLSTFIYKGSGVVVTSVDKNNKCSEIKEGRIITQVGGFAISNKEDFKNSVQVVKENEYVAMVVNGGPGSCVALKEGYLGIEVENIPSSQLKFGLDIQGGATNIIESKEDKEKILRIIEKRIISFGFPETRVHISNDKVKITSLMPEKIGLLIVKGEFEAGISNEIKLEDKSASIKIEDKVYSVELIDEKIKVNDSVYQINQKFSLEDIEFNLKNITNNSIILEAKIFENEDVTKVLTAFSFVRYNPDLRIHEFNIPLEISSEASKRFIKVTKGLKTTFVDTQPILEGFLVYYLDGEQISRLNIPFEMAGKEIKNIAVAGFRANKEEALNEKKKIQSILESGKLPELKIIGTETYEPPLRKITLEISLLAIASITFFVFSQNYLRYKKPVFGLYVLLLLGAEFLCIFGVISLTQILFTYSWIVDFPSILGLIAFGFLSSSQFLLLTEDRIRKREMNISYKFKKIISLMSLSLLVPFTISFLLLFTFYRGFGLSIISGLIIGILATKPVYQEILKSLT